MQAKETCIETEKVGVILIFLKRVGIMSIRRSHSDYTSNWTKVVVKGEDLGKDRVNIHLQELALSPKLRKGV